MYRYSEKPIYVLPDITGLVRWVDYIPVQETAGVGTANSYNDDGFLNATEVLDSITGLRAWVDYTPVYLDGTAPWAVSSVGYIPFDEASQSLLLMETGDHLLLEDGGDLLL